MDRLEILCPHCGQSVEVTEAIAAPLLDAEKKKVNAEVSRRVTSEIATAEQAWRAEAASEAETKIRAAKAMVADSEEKLKQAQANELALRQDREQLRCEKEELELTIQRRIDEITQKKVSEARTALERDWQSKLEAANARLEEKDTQLRAAEQLEVQAREMKFQAEESHRQTELTVARRLDEERARVREGALRERDEEVRLRLADKDKVLSELREQIEELRRKGERPAQQLMGDVLELDLHALLSAAFPDDSLERVKKGQSGADLLQLVRNRSGQECGRILWEVKRTKAWSNAWLTKLRDDQHTAKADIAALMTETLPDHAAHFDCIAGVWVSGISTAVPMAAVLRQGIIDVARARASTVSASTKKDLVYSYLTGIEFKQRVRALVEPVTEMRTTLDQERRYFTKLWSTREKQIERVERSVCMLYGELHGIIGPSLPAVEGLSLALLVLDEDGAFPNSASAIGLDGQADDEIRAISHSRNEGNQ